MATPPPTAAQPTTLRNIIIPSISLNNISSESHSANDTQPPSYDITIGNHRITSITRHPSLTNDSIPGPPSLVLPTLTHPHIHLDKPYLLTSHSTHHSSSQPNYAPLAPKSGTFPEALQLTASAKSLFTPSDLLLRGRQLLATSYTQGVTSARCFAEVDDVVGRKCLDAGLALQREFGGVVGVQLCVFAQEVVMSGEEGNRNRGWVEKALEEELGAGSLGAEGKEGDEFTGIRVLGSTPYVESSWENAIKNIEWAVRTALKYDLHLDFHLDYNLDEEKALDEGLLVWEVIRILQREGWPTNPPPSPPASKNITNHKRRTVLLGHCTALTTLPHHLLQRLATEISVSNLPIYFVGLPTSDLYMMGRPSSLPEPNNQNSISQHQTIRTMQRQRGTLNIPLLRRLYGINAVVGVNNMGNAFTPYGSGDPLELASWCVGVMQDGTEMGARVLFEGVSGGARRAMGLEEEVEEKEECRDGMVEWLREGMDLGHSGILVVRNEEYITSSSEELISMRVPARQRWSLRDVVWDTPRVELRQVVR